MCVMSAITLQAEAQWPSVRQITNLELLIQMQKVLQAVEALDKKFSLSECIEPGKVEYLKQLEDRIAELEGKITKIKEHVAS